jgi:putative heme d1 biosynthesis radical SAM protein NirJ1
MISVSKLLCDSGSFGDTLRYARHSVGATAGATCNRGPVVVWNCTRSCNLRCLHCYYASEPLLPSPTELSTQEAQRFIDDLAAFRVPVLLISGGEPLVRRDILDLAAYAADKGIRVTFSTNGTLLTRDIVKRLKQIGVGYVGISFDGVGSVHDYFRARDGAFAASLAGVRLCLEEGQKVGVRFTMNRHNREELPRIFDFIEAERIPRACFYHLVYSGRGAQLREYDLTHEETRRAVDLIIERTEAMAADGQSREILTVDNHTDGVYIYLTLLRRGSPRAETVRQLLEANGGNRSGIAIAAVDHEGNVHPDQFSTNHTLGNIRERPFSLIWSQSEHPLLAALRRRKQLLKGRCRACKWLSLCNGNFRARAEAVYGDYWAPDPACYLTDEEIGVASASASA